MLSTFLDLLPVVVTLILGLVVVVGVDTDLFGEVSGEDLGNDVTVGQVDPGVLDCETQVEGVQPLEYLPRHYTASRHTAQHYINIDSILFRCTTAYSSSWGFEALFVDLEQCFVFESFNCSLRCLG